MTGKPTTDTELRDLLTTEAAGPSGPGGWDDVVRRGRHRQRVRRVRSVALVAVVAGVAVTAVALSGGDASIETGPPANQPSPSPSTVTDGSEPTSRSTTTVPPPDDGRPHVQAARAQGAFLTLLIPWADPASGFDPCIALHPRVVESAEQIGVELVTEEVERGVPFATCHATPFSGRGLIELTDPVGDRPVVDLTTGNAVFLVDGASLLFPTSLPAGFDPEERDEFASQGAWTFTFSSTTAPVYLNVTTGYGGAGECDREPIQVRGTEGRLCRVDEYGRYDLHWEEGGRTIAIEVGSSEPETDSGVRVDDVLAIAEGLEPLGG